MALKTFKNLIWGMTNLDKPFVRCTTKWRCDNKSKENHQHPKISVFFFDRPCWNRSFYFPARFPSGVLLRKCGQKDLLLWLDHKKPATLFFFCPRKSQRIFTDSAVSRNRSSAFILYCRVQENHRWFQFNQSYTRAR